jgi:Spx/MgsR family transcriptional regulator
MLEFSATIAHSSPFFMPAPSTYSGDRTQATKTGKWNMLKVYGIKNCDTMKKAFAWLEANAVAYEFIDYKKEGVAENHLPDWNRRAGWQRLLNTHGMMWKRLSDEERVDVDETKALALMADYPTLIKRPVADTGSELLVGFEPERYEREMRREPG